MKKYIKPTMAVERKALRASLLAGSYSGEDNGICPKCHHPVPGHHKGWCSFRKKWRMLEIKTEIPWNREELKEFEAMMNNFTANVIYQASNS